MAEDEQLSEITVAAMSPWRSDPALMVKRIESWCAHTMAPDVTVVDVTNPEGSGMSSETLLFTVRRGDGAPEDYVARLAPLPTQQFTVFPTYDLEMQRRVMQLVARETDVPVPESPWYEPDDEWLGSRFIVMRRVDGVVPTDIPSYPMVGWVVDASPADRARLERSAVSVLARLHEITPERHDLSFLEQPQHGSSPLDQHLGYQRWYYEWAREGLRVPLIERAFEVLDATRPTEGPGVLNWGDSRLGNMMFRDFEAVAVLDWEMAAIGPAEVDIGWMIFLHRFFQDMAARFGMPGLPDMLQRERVATIYEELSGRAPRDLEWFELFAALRFAIISIRTSLRGFAYGQADAPADPDDLIMFRAILEQMLAATP